MFVKALKVFALGLFLVVVVGVAAFSSLGGVGQSLTTVRQMMAEPTVDVELARPHANYIDPRLLKSNPKDYVGDNVIILGKALNVEQGDDYTWVNVQARIRGTDNNWNTETVIVTLTPPNPLFLSGRCYKFYGIVQGTMKAIRSLTGTEIELPHVAAYDHERSAEGEYGGCAPSQAIP